ncbi:MAG: arsenate reductase (glutaredoxin) [Paracoccaceae bacterium]|nr:arsenate reductase (glutaredoxin) [Paracoccaceae bacterium]
MALTIWHNPRCSKSRQALTLLKERGFEPTVRLYLKDTPSIEEIADVLAMLGLSAIKMMRTGEPEFKASGLSKDSEENELIAAMAQTPKLIERAIVINGSKAALGRPPESILKIL